MGNEKNIIIYNTDLSARQAGDGKAAVRLMAKDGSIWMNQNELAELFATSKQNIGQHIANILEEKELSKNSVVKNFFTTAADGKGKMFEKELARLPDGQDQYLENLNASQIILSIPKSLKSCSDQ